MEIIQQLNITEASSRQGGPWNKVPCLGPDNRDLVQRDNNYYTLRLSNPDYQGHFGAFIGA